MLQYSWVDIDLILDCVDAWVQRFAASRFFQHRKLWGDPDTSHKLDDDPGGFGNYKSARQYFQHDYDAFCSHIDDHLPQVDNQSSWIEVHRDTQIPDDLLAGPWNERATQKLFWLVRAGARLSAEQTWETTLEAYHCAMGAGTAVQNGGINLPVIRLLMILGGNHWPPHIASTELEKLQAKERLLRANGEQDAYHKHACVASMLIQRYSTPAPDN
jgi:hypothetical protein